MKLQNRLDSKGFTLVEVLIVIICIGILAGLIVVGYGAISNNAKETSLKSDLVNGSAEISTKKSHDGTMPTDTSGLDKKASTTFTSYTHNDANKTYCLTAIDSSLPGVTLRITETGVIERGSCDELPVDAGDSMQNVTTASCPTSRTLLVDGRDRKTYWVQRLADEKCWMLTNLAYVGGGNNAYSDAIALQDGTNDGTASYTVAKYFTVPLSNVTRYPTQPTVTTDGGSTNPQYGYLYNWCAAMGAQAGTAACLNATSPAANSAISVCPMGWRLPTGGPGGEVAALTSALGATNNTAGANMLRSVLLWQQTGTFRLSYTQAGVYGYAWTSTQRIASQSYMLSIGMSSYNALGDGTKDTGFSVRCVTI